mgnify:CR=1 FL=1
MEQSITEIERKILDFMVHYLRSNTFQPSIREIGERFGISNGPGRRPTSGCESQIVHQKAEAVAVGRKLSDVWCYSRSPLGLRAVRWLKPERVAELDVEVQQLDGDVLITGYRDG